MRHAKPQDGSRLMGQYRLTSNTTYACGKVQLSGLESVVRSVLPRNFVSGLAGGFSLAGGHGGSGDTHDRMS